MVTSIYTEVKCTHNENGFWVVDAWQSNDPNEEGQVVAVINDVTGDCYAIKPLDDLAKSVIGEKQTEIDSQDVERLSELYHNMPDAKQDAFLREIEN